MRFIVILIVSYCLSTVLHAQVVDEATFNGKVNLSGKLTPYSLQIVYKPDAWRGSSDIDRSIDKILLSINGREIAFSQKALEGLYGVTAPSAIYTDGLDPNHGRFTIQGGGGEKQFEVAFIFDTKHLLSRELHYTRLMSKDVPVEVIHFDAER